MRKKLVGDYLRNADRLLKEGEYERAFAEVEKSLELEPGNFYAQAYRDRISALREKHGRTGEAPAPPHPREEAAGDVGGPPTPELKEITGARIEEIPAGEPDASESRDLEELKDQIARDRASHEDETSRQTEEFARKALEDELRQRGEVDRLKAAEQAALAAALAEARDGALTEVLARARDAFGMLISGGDTEGAFREIATIRIIAPSDARLDEMTRTLDAATASAADAAGGETTGIPRDAALQWYGKFLRSAWGEGKPNGTQASLLAAARTRLSVTPEEEKQLLPPTQREIMTLAMREAYKDGEPDVEAKSSLETLARDLSVGDLGPGQAPITK